MVISGSGNVAQFSCQKAIELGAKLVTLSDSSGDIYDQEGITHEKLEFIFHLKNVKKGRTNIIQIRTPNKTLQFTPFV